MVPWSSGQDGGGVARRSTSPEDAAIAVRAEVAAAVAAFCPDAAKQPNVPFMKLGMDSLEIEALASRLSKSFDLEVNPTILFLRNNLQDLQEYCAEEVCEPNQAAPAEAPAPAKAARARRPGVLPAPGRPAPDVGDRIAEDAAPPDGPAFASPEHLRGLSLFARPEEDPPLLSATSVARVLGQLDVYLAGGATPRLPRFHHLVFHGAVLVPLVAGLHRAGFFKALETEGLSIPALAERCGLSAGLVAASVRYLGRFGWVDHVPHCGQVAKYVLNAHYAFRGAAAGVLEDILAFTSEAKDGLPAALRGGAFIRLVSHYLGDWAELCPPDCPEGEKETLICLLDGALLVPVLLGLKTMATNLGVVGPLQALADFEKDPLRSRVVKLVLRKAKIIVERPACPSADKRRTATLTQAAETSPTLTRVGNIYWENTDRLQNTADILQESLSECWRAPAPAAHRVGMDLGERARQGVLTSRRCSRDWKPKTDVPAYMSIEGVAAPAAFCKAADVLASAADLGLSPGKEILLPDQLVHALFGKLLHLRNTHMEGGFVLAQYHPSPRAAAADEVLTSDAASYELAAALAGRWGVPLHRYLLVAATAGLFPKDFAVESVPTSLHPRFSTVHFVPQDFHLEFVTEAHIGDCMRLEALHWQGDMRTPRETIARRIANYPQGQVALVKNGAMLAVMYSQLIESVDVLSVREGMERLHSPAGKHAQLLEIFVDTSTPQAMMLGGFLRRFVKAVTLANPQVESIVAVTRGREWTSQKHYLPYAQYVEEVAARRLQDKGLHFHLGDGAEVLKPMEGWRPADTANNGYGVLIEYRR